MYRIYLDTCCFNRPFDDQSQPRVKREAEAVLAILQRIGAGDWRLVGGDVLEQELEVIPDPEQRIDLLGLVRKAALRVSRTDALVKRAAALMRMGFTHFDALHVASAESAGADVLLTTDDGLRKRARRLRDDLMVLVEDPVTWLNEVRER